MQRSAALRFLEQNRGFTVNAVLKQYWKRTHYSYRDTPRPDCGLMLLLHGQAQIVTETAILTARVGNVLFLPKGAYYEAVFQGEVEDLLVNFDTLEVVEDAFEPTLLLRNAPLGCSENFDALLAEVLSGEPSVLRLRGLLYLLLDSIITGTASAGEQLTEQAKRLLKNEAEMTIAQIAKKLGCSESGFRKTFREATGLSPVEYRLRYRLERAKYLLESTDWSITQIAEALQIYDAAYFCKMFKKHTGLPPAQYAKRKRL